MYRRQPGVSEAKENADEVGAQEADGDFESNRSHRSAPHLQIELPGEQGSALHGNVDVTVYATRDGIGVQHVVTLANRRPRHETQVVLIKSNQEREMSPIQETIEQFSIYQGKNSDADQKLGFAGGVCDAWCHGHFMTVQSREDPFISVLGFVCRRLRLWARSAVGLIHVLTGWTRKLGARGWQSTVWK